MTDLEYENLVIVSNAKRYIQWTADLIDPFVGGRVLEIGAGFGDLFHILAAECVSYEPTDIEPLFDGCKKLDIAKEKRTEKFDTIIASNVFEHLPVSDRAWRNVRDMLLLGGQFILIVPYGRELYGSLDQAVGHYLRYEDWIVRKELPRNMEIKEIIKFNRMGSVGWWINCKLGKQLFNPKQIEFLEFLVPVLRKIDPFLPFKPLSAIYIIQRC